MQTHLVYFFDIRKVILYTVLEWEILLILKVELQVQGSRKRTEVAKIGKEPVSKRETLIEECYAELVEMAKVLSMFISYIQCIYTISQLQTVRSGLHLVTYLDVGNFCNQST